MLKAATVTDITELEQILMLQSINLKQHLSEKEKQEQGFLTMQFTLDMLMKMHQLAPSIIVKNNENKVVAYAISFLKEGREVYPQMEPMFRHFEKITWKGRRFTEMNYYIMGQICVAREARGMGAVGLLYQKHKDEFSHRFECIVTEISENNLRSLNAHRRVGFECISTHQDEIDQWQVVAWDWSTVTSGMTL